MPLTLFIENEDRLPDGGPLRVEVSGRGLDIGRDEFLDWTLPDSSKFISGKHCEIRFLDGRYVLDDCSTNGTFLNGDDQRMPRPYELRDGDRLQIGHYLVSVQISGVDANVLASSPADDDPYASYRQGVWDAVGEAADPIDSQDLKPRRPRPAAGDFLDSYADISAPRAAPPSASADFSGDPWGSEVLPPREPDPAPVISDGWGGEPGNAGPASADPWGAGAASGGGRGENDGMGGSPAASAAAQTPSQSMEDQLGHDGFSASEELAPPPSVAKVAPPPPGSLSCNAASSQMDPNTEQGAAAVGESTPQSPAPQPPSPQIPVPASAAMARRNPVPPGRAEQPDALWPDAPDLATPEPVQEVAPPPEPKPVERLRSPHHRPPQQPDPDLPMAAPPEFDTSQAERVIAKFAEGAGLPPDVFAGRDPEELAGEIGAMLQQMTGHLQQLLAARASAKAMARASSRTMVQAIDNNPLKFLPTPSEALRIMLGPKTSSYLDANRTIEDTFADLKRHQLNTYAAMQHAIGRMTEDLAPDTIEGGTDTSGMMTNKKAKLWETYKTRWDSKVEAHENGIIDVFMLYFADYYDKNQR